MAIGSTLIIIILISVFLIQYFWSNICRGRKVISYFLIPITLLGLWFSLIVYQAYEIENVFSILTTEYFRHQLNSYPKDELLQGQKIVGSFKATNDYLGIVGFRFWTFYRLNSDYMIFRIKPSSDTQWYYQNRYLSDQFQPNQYFTFGFPTIDKSAGVSYDFEIESFAGKPGDAVGVSKEDPIYVTKYKYPKAQIISSPLNILMFVLTKFFNLMSKAEFKASSYIYLLPFVVYLLALSSQYSVVGNKTRSTIFKIISTFISSIANGQAQISFLLVIAGIVLDIIFVSRGDITLILLMTLIWQISRHFSFQDRLFLFLGFIFLIFSGITYYLNVPQISERSAAWTWVFLVLLVINSLKSYKHSTHL